MAELLVMSVQHYLISIDNLQRTSFNHNSILNTMYPCKSDCNARTVDDVIENMTSHHLGEISAGKDTGTDIKVQEWSDCAISGVLARLLGIVVAMETTGCISFLSTPQKNKVLSRTD